MGRPNRRPIDRIVAFDSAQLKRGTSMSPQTAASIYTLDFSNITHEDVGRVGGKNASLGEMLHAVKPKGVGVLDGFATTADAYRFGLATHGFLPRAKRDE
jgi:Pyruvate phosphate dikinase, AMP/ATP-binding domain